MPEPCTHPVTNYRRDGSQRCPKCGKFALSLKNTAQSKPRG